MPWTAFEMLPSCPVCKASRFHLAQGADICRCDTCEVYFRSPRPTQEAIKQSYDLGINYSRWQEEAAVRDSMWETRMAIVRKFKTSGSLLDIGTGDGRFLETAQRNGFTVDSTELSDTGIEYINRRGFSVRKGQVTDIDFGANRYDVVSLWHVLEHVPNPFEVIRKCHGLLHPGGRLFIGVPNEDYAFTRHFFRKLRGLPIGDTPLGEIPYGGEIHLTHFQPKTLKRLLRSNGFKICAFGVDDVSIERDAKTRASMATQRQLSKLTGWHVSKAMYVVGERVS